MECSIRGELLSQTNQPPFSVITEQFQHQLAIPDYDPEEGYSFGERYEDAMFGLIHRHLELDTHDRLAYVGSHRGSLAGKIRDKFCLMRPMVNVFPGLIHYEETASQTLLPLRIAHVGAEEYFKQLADESRGREPKGPPFDKVLLKDSVEHFSDPRKTFADIMRTLAPTGRLLIIHRPGSAGTLPLFTGATKKFDAEGANSEESYARIIKNLRALNVDVKWEIETLPIVMPKVKWLAMLKRNFPPPLEAISVAQMTTGIRELTEGMLKYQGEEVEFFDRLLFVTATHPFVENGYPSIQRCGTLETQPYPNIDRMKYILSVTPEIHRLIGDVETRKEGATKLLH